MPTFNEFTKKAYHDIMKADVSTTNSTILKLGGGDMISRRCRVLVVEDNVVNRRVENLLLQKLGCEVRLALYLFFIFH